MRNIGWTRDPIATFAVPPNPPSEVADALAKFDTAGTRLGELQGQLQDLEQAHKTQLADARQQSIQAVADGKRNPVDLHKLEQDQAREIQTIRRHIEVASGAVHLLGDRLATSISEHADTWADQFQPVIETASATYDQALTQATTSASEIAQARGAAEWLQGFDADLAKAGRQPEFRGGTVRIEIELRDGLSSGNVTPATLVKILRRLLDQDTPPEPRTVRVVASSRG